MLPDFRKPTKLSHDLHFENKISFNIEFETTCACGSLISLVLDYSHTIYTVYLL